MKKPVARSHLALLLASLAGAASAEDQIPTDSHINFSPLPENGFMRIAIADPGNHTWNLQVSHDLLFWYEFETIKVHNGRFAKNLHVLENTPRSFYRLNFDPVLQAGESRVSQALALPSTPDNYALPSLPAHFLTPRVIAQDNTPADNPVTDRAATLGRVLFYDKRLSANNTISCASCHQQEHGFSDPRQFSIGFRGEETDRNSMGLTNAKYYERGHFFWDERSQTLEEQVLEPIQNEVEMGLTLDELVTKVSAERYYAELFTSAFGDAVVTSERISLAIAQFIRSIISTESKFDLGRSSNFSNFTPQENQGRRIFNGQGRCDDCHGTDNFVSDTVFNNGLENPYTDPGIGAITRRQQDLGKFKTPSLRNIALTGPYMHDGRFRTLEEVVEFYDSQVVNHPNLAPQLRNNNRPIRLNLSEAEKRALVAFLNTLTDPNLTTDPKYSDPFNYGD